MQVPILTSTMSAHKATLGNRKGEEMRKISNRLVVLRILNIVLLGCGASLAFSADAMNVQADCFQCSPQGKCAPRMLGNPGSALSQCMNEIDSGGTPYCMLWGSAC